MQIKCDSTMHVVMQNLFNYSPPPPLGKEEGTFFNKGMLLSLLTYFKV